MARKLTYEQVKAEFDKRGFELLSNEYINSSEKLDFKCPNHPQYILSMPYRKFKEGHGCKYCANENRGKQQRKYNIEQLRQMFLERGYTLLNNEYINNNTPLNYICPKHPNEINKILLGNFRKGHGCSFCAREARADKQRHTIEFVRKEFEKRGYTLLENEYINNKHPMKFKCPIHPDKENKIAYSDFLKSQGCKYCGFESIADYRRLPFEVVKNAFNEKGLILLETEYKDNITKMKYKCPIHPNEEQYMTYNNLYSGRGCPLCSYENRRGENNYFWKGGVSELNNYLRQYLYDWKINSFEKYNYSCFITNEKGNDLEVHHTKPFNIIRDEVLNKLNVPIHQFIKDYNQQTLNKIVDLFIEEHNKKLGVPIKKELHKLFHNIYGWDEMVSFNDVIEFKERYLNGEFTTTLSI